MGIERKEYKMLPTMEAFHSSDAIVRCIVGPVGSGKTTAAAHEICLLLPAYIAKTYGVTQTRWCIVRNSYRELQDTTLPSVMDWYSFGTWHASDMMLEFHYPPSTLSGGYPMDVEILFRSCNKPDDMRKFKSLELTGGWIEESVELNEETKKMFINRLGRYPNPKMRDQKKCPGRWLIETTNPCSIDHEMYWKYNWVPAGEDPLTCPKDINGRFTPWTVPGPYPKAYRKPIEDYFGWWQPPHENDENLKEGYYEDLMRDYGNNKEWINMYILGQPGVRVRGKPVYANYQATKHSSRELIEWNGTPLYMGWDNSGIHPAAVLLQIRGPLQVDVLQEWQSEGMGIVDFSKMVLANINEWYPGAVIAAHYGDPAGGARFSRGGGIGGMTSNAELQWEECGIRVLPSEQNFDARRQAVDQMLLKKDGLCININCTWLINGFQGAYVFPEKMGQEGEFLQNPIKNRWSHVHDALQYVLVRLFSPRKRQEIEREVKNHVLYRTEKYLDEHSDNDYDEFRHS